MLIEFKIGNFLSFKDKATFTMVPASIKELEDTAVFHAAGNMRLLKSAVIYGANASGKSNLIKSLRFLRWFALNSSKESQAAEKIPITKYALSTESQENPCHFELSFIHKGTRYRYGFELDEFHVVNEWLFSAPYNRERKLFIREGQNFEIGDHFKEGKGLENKIRNNALFLSVAAQFNGPTSMEVIEWFTVFNIVSGLNDQEYFQYSINKLRDEFFRTKILKFIGTADLNIQDIRLKETKLSEKELPDSIKETLIETRKKIAIERSLPVDQIVMFNEAVNAFHDVYDNNLNKISTVAFDLFAESDGTQKLFGLSGPILDTLQYGKVLVIDELDARLHPEVTDFIVQLFNSRDLNQKNAQLLFATHDVHLLSNQLFRRDQIWFTEKNRYGATNLFSLSDYDVRKDATYSKDYLAGKYGAVPMLGDPKELIADDGSRTE